MASKRNSGEYKELNLAYLGDAFGIVVSHVKYLEVFRLKQVSRDIFNAIKLYVKELNMTESGITDLTPLASLTYLTKLDLGSTGVTDLRPLASLTLLTELILSCTRVTDVTPLASLPHS